MKETLIMPLVLTHTVCSTTDRPLWNTSASVFVTCIGGQHWLHCYRYDISAYFHTPGQLVIPDIEIMRCSSYTFYDHSAIKYFIESFSVEKYITQQAPTLATTLFQLDYADVLNSVITRIRKEGLPGAMLSKYQTLRTTPEVVPELLQ